MWRQLRATIPVRAGILAIDDRGFPNRATTPSASSANTVAPRGKIGNCQVALSSVLIGDGPAWPLSFELYLPQIWITDAERRAAVRLPDRMRFREKWRIALAHIRAVRAAGLTLDGVLAGADYGSTAAFRRGLEKLRLRYGVAVRGDVTCWYANAVRPLTAAVLALDHAGGCVDARRPSRKPHASGLCGAARLPREERGRPLAVVRALDRRRGPQVLPPQPAAVGAPPRGGGHSPVVAGRSSNSIANSKTNRGSTISEGRTYRGWTHHTVLVAVAFTFLQLERGRGDPAQPRPTLPAVRAWVCEVVAVLFIIHTRRVLTLIDDFRRDPPLRR